MKKQTKLDVAHWLVSGAPLLSLVVFYAMAACATYKLGHTPVYMQDDPKLILPTDILYNALFGFFEVSWLLAVFSLPAWLIQCAVITHPHTKTLVFRGGLFAFSWACVVFVCRYDPGNWVRWLMD